MSVHRNGAGQIKRTTGTRSNRRAHLQGALRLIDQQKRAVESFKGRMLSMLRRAFA